MSIKKRHCLYGVFANEDVCCDDKVIMKKDDLIGVVRSDECGEIETIHLPLKTYYVRELRLYEMHQLLLMHYGL